MKRVLILSIIFLIFCTYFIAAVENTVSEKGYSCLENKVREKCSSLSAEEKIFSLLTIDRCKAEVVDESADNKCWPDSGCKIKTTAQAILALSSVGVNTIKAENWLLSQTINPPDVDWLLQIEANPTTCSISYLGNSYSVSIDEDRKISSNAGACLKLYEDNYWLKVSPTCYNEEFRISCSQTFSTSLLFKKKDSEVVYVSKTINSASAEGTTTEKINSFCFKQGVACNYEGSLWAALILKFRGYDASPYLPYLITMKDENSEFLPESFLYSLTNNFNDELLLKQKESKWWSESGDKFYDTAVALYSLQHEEPQEKINAKAWLEEVQGSDGCWQGNIRNTAFILFSVWPKKTLINDSDIDCEDTGNYCMSDAACQEAGGNVLVSYTGCFGTNVCCDTKELLESCSLQNGEVCGSNEICSGGTFVDAANTERCCIGGTCAISTQTEESECEIKGGECRTSCFDNEKSSAYDCPSFDLCCIKKTGGYGWIWLLGILIILTIIGILFKDKLRKYWFKAKSKFRKTKPGPRRRPRFPPGPSAAITRRPTPRRILPPGHRPPRKYVPTRKPKGELDAVLKKLKEMGK